MDPAAEAAGQQLQEVRRSHGAPTAPPADGDVIGALEADHAAAQRANENAREAKHAWPGVERRGSTGGSTGGR